MPRSRCIGRKWQYAPDDFALWGVLYLAIHVFLLILPSVMLLNIENSDCIKVDELVGPDRASLHNIGLRLFGVGVIVTAYDLVLQCWTMRLPISTYACLSLPDTNDDAVCEAIRSTHNAHGSVDESDDPRRKKRKTGTTLEKLLVARLFLQYYMIVWVSCTWGLLMQEEVVSIVKMEIDILLASYPIVSFLLVTMICWSSKMDMNSKTYILLQKLNKRNLEVNDQPGRRKRTFVYTFYLCTFHFIRDYIVRHMKAKFYRLVDSHTLQLLRHFTKGFDLTLVDIFVGILLLRAKHHIARAKEQKFHAESNPLLNPETDRSTMNFITRYMDFAMWPYGCFVNAICDKYGHLQHTAIPFPCGCAMNGCSVVCSRIPAEDRKVFITGQQSESALRCFACNEKHISYRRERKRQQSNLQLELVHVCFTNRHTPPWYAMVDKTSDTLIIGIRGTISVKDCIADIQAELVPFRANESEEDSPDEYCHYGTLKVALHILKTMRERKMLDTVEHVVFCGHSLGAGIASFLSLLVYKYHIATEGTNVQRFLKLESTRALCLSHPNGLLSPRLANLAQDKGLVVALVLADDIVGRASYVGAEFARDRMIRELRACQRSKLSVVLLSFLGSTRRIFTEEQNDDVVCSTENNEHFADYIKVSKMNSELSTRSQRFSARSQRVGLGIVPGSKDASNPNVQIAVKDPLTDVMKDIDGTKNDMTGNQTPSECTYQNLVEGNSCNSVEGNQQVTNKSTSNATPVQRLCTRLPIIPTGDNIRLDEIEISARPTFETVDSGFDPKGTAKRNSSKDSLNRKESKGTLESKGSLQTPLEGEARKDAEDGQATRQQSCQDGSMQQSVSTQQGDAMQQTGSTQESTSVQQVGLMQNTGSPQPRSSSKDVAAQPATQSVHPGHVAQPLRNSADLNALPRVATEVLCRNAKRVCQIPGDVILLEPDPSVAERRVLCFPCYRYHQQYIARRVLDPLNFFSLIIFSGKALESHLQWLVREAWFSVDKD